MYTQLTENSMEKTPRHYYGDIIRFLFLSVAIVMLVGLPIIARFLSLPPIVSVFAILMLGLAAGLTNPRQAWTAVVNVGIAIIGFVTFALSAVSSYQTHSAHSRFFISNLILAFIFLLTVYLSTKTLRGFLLNRTA